MENISYSVKDDDMFSTSSPTNTTNDQQSYTIYWIIFALVVALCIYLAKDSIMTYLGPYLGPYLSLGQQQPATSPLAAGPAAGPSLPPPPPNQNPNNSLNNALQQATDQQQQQQQQQQQNTSYSANDAYSSNLEGKSGWCFIGEDQGQRTCNSVGYADTCMSGKIFPTQDVCINPSLRP
jgi:hypothetical protein